MKIRFGIDVWVSNLRRPPLSVPAEKAEKWKQFDPHNTTLAYMTLPNNVLSREDWDGVADFADF